MKTKYQLIIPFILCQSFFALLDASTLLDQINVAQSNLNKANSALTNLIVLKIDNSTKTPNQEAIPFTVSEQFQDANLVGSYNRIKHKAIIQNPNVANAKYYKFKYIKEKNNQVKPGKKVYYIGNFKAKDSTIFLYGVIAENIHKSSDLVSRKLAITDKWNKDKAATDKKDTTDKDKANFSNNVISAQKAARSLAVTDKWNKDKAVSDKAATDEKASADLSNNSYSAQNAAHTLAIIDKWNKDKAISDKNAADAKAAVDAKTAQDKAAADLTSNLIKTKGAARVQAITDKWNKDKTK